MSEITEYSHNECVNKCFAENRNLKFYRNVFGWNVYYTDEPTFATPTGNDPAFPRQVEFKWSKTSATYLPVIVKNPEL